jgi:hypothetical protein
MSTTNQELLLSEAQKLMMSLNQICWALASSQQRELYNKATRIHQKSIERYSRRYEKVYG